MLQYQGSMHVAFTGNNHSVLKQDSNLGPSWSGHSLRFLDSALDGSEVFSPIPLILNTYQQLKQKTQGVGGSEKSWWSSVWFIDQQWRNFDFNQKLTTVLTDVHV